MATDPLSLVLMVIGMVLFSVFYLGFYCITLVIISSTGNNGIPIAFTLASWSLAGLLLGIIKAIITIALEP